MMMQIKYLDYITYWSIILLPFSMSIAPAPMNVFMGLAIFAFLLKKILKKEYPFARTALNLPLIFLFIITSLSIFNSISYKDSLKGGMLRLLQYIVMFFIMLEEVKDKRHIKKIVLLVIFGLILVSLDGLFQVFTGKDFIRQYSPVVNIGLVRATASFKDANTFGIYLSALTPLLFGLTLYYFRGRKKIIMSIISIMVLVAALITYSRPTILAIYIALFILAIIKRDKVLIGFLIILVLLSPFILPQSVKNWAKEVQYNPIRFMCNDDRIAIYRNTLNMIKAHPIIGVGANTYMKNYKTYKESPEYRNVVTSDYMYAHNNFLHIAAEIGLVGLAVFIWLLYALFAECKNIYRRLNDGFLKTTLLSLVACLVSFLINGLTESSLYYSRVAIIFWYLAGFSLSLKKIY